MKAVSPPKIKVLDRAIETVEKAWGYLRFSCNAIVNSLPDNVASSTSRRYQDQYKTFIKTQNGGRLPWWWNNRKPCKKARIDALTRFRQACIDAAKDKQ
jgi:hypothetical protein